MKISDWLNDLTKGLKKAIQESEKKIGTFLIKSLIMTIQF